MLVGLGGKTHSHHAVYLHYSRRGFLFDLLADI